MFCECGCGGITSISKQNDVKMGYVKGKHRRYLPGHNQKKCKNKLRQRCYAPSCSRSDSNGYALKYHVNVEKIMEKPLPTKAVIHHHNDNQLVVCENQAYHRFLHQRIKALRTCGHADWVKCVRCHQYDDPINLSGQGKNSYHKSCATQYQRERRSH